MLFASAFDTPIATASALEPLAVPGAGKRKRRHSASGGSGGDAATTAAKNEQLRATQVNLAKLMERVERGEVKDKDRSGREEMGNMGGGKKKKPKNQHSAGTEEQLPGWKAAGKGKGAPPPPPKSPKSPASKDTRQKGKKQKGGPNFAPQPDTPKGKLPKIDKNHKEQPIPKGGVKNKPAPVEIELPTPAKSSKAATDDGLTEMQRKMQTKLEGARFRWINEQLYTTSSDVAVDLMDKDPKVFADYHETHRQLTAAWPMPPLPYIISLLTPLPRGTVIADLGCGDADLARALVPAGKTVLSFDLVGDVGGRRSVGSEGWVVPCDFLSGVPLPGRPGGGDAAVEGGKKKHKGKKADPAASEIVDVVVCCLSLMGTNWIGGVYEAVRILKQGGTFHVAEVTSRFVSTQAFIDAITSFGLVLDSQEEPSTHFTLFKFTKTVPAPLAPVRSQDGWDERVAAGEEILRACIYKRR